MTTIVKKVTTKDFADKVIELAEENPEYVYDSGDTQRCQYIRNGKGDCIVGQAAEALGFSVETIQKYEGQPAEYMIRRLLGMETYYKDSSYVEDHYVTFCDYVQSEQDQKTPWGFAVNKNLEFLPGDR